MPGIRKVEKATRLRRKEKYMPYSTDTRDNNDTKKDDKEGSKSETTNTGAVMEAEIDDIYGGSSEDKD